MICLNLIITQAQKRAVDALKILFLIIFLDSSHYNDSVILHGIFIGFFLLQHIITEPGYLFASLSNSPGGGVSCVNFGWVCAVKGLKT